MHLVERALTRGRSAGPGSETGIMAWISAMVTPSEIALAMARRRIPGARCRRIRSASGESWLCFIGQG